ncbi:ABC transporter permease [Ligilactobacillus sp. WILCCON 0076]|uniref:ABC transporter permease n=1 Tax=Ligilactobacillus ubinensis TaxID=2876789 RepID=A0A9X2FKK8_9LACO|nr:ABC transporter permease [Ligilactobacillus ubinensis]MCP0886053.1 ABC transporter permease [Ligilactobacillus ubinensis]
MNKFWIITKRVYCKNLKSGSWLFLVFSPLILVIIAAGIIYYISQNNQPVQVAVVSNNYVVTQFLKKSSNSEIQYENLTAKQANKKLINKEITGILKVKTKPVISAKYVELSNAETSLAIRKVQATLYGLKLNQTATQLHLTVTQLHSLASPVQVKKEIVSIENGKQIVKSNSTSVFNYVLSTGLTIFIMLIITIYGQIVAQEIAIEKGSRIMEILLTSVSATTHFFAKLTAILFLLITQLSIYFVIGKISWMWLKEQTLVKSFLPSVNIPMCWSTYSLTIILFFIIGTMTFAVLAALLGSLVSNQEQINMAVMPISLLALAGYFLSLMALSGDSTLVKFFSYIPFINIELMPVRLSLQHTTLIAANISLAIAALFLTGLTFLATKVYQSNILVYSKTGLIKKSASFFVQKNLSN